MSSALYIDPFLLSSTSTAKSWLAASQIPPSSRELDAFISSTSDAAWEDAISQMQVAFFESTQLLASRPSETKSEDRPRRTTTGRKALAPVLETQPSPTNENVGLPSSGESETITVASEPAGAKMTQRQRNRLAASKTRRKKDVAVKQLELDERALSRHHGHLLEQATGLEEQVVALKGLLLEHQGCSCDGIHNYLAFHENV